MDCSRPRKSTNASRSLLESLKARKKKQRLSGRRRRLGAAIEPLEQRNLLTFAIDLFADVNILGVSSSIGEAVELGGETFFVADDGKTGSELWKTDGTEAGTVQVKDILPGPDTSSPSELTVVGGEIFFTALDDTNETDLWKTDGTESGTVLVYDANASSVYYLTQLTESGGKLFFTAEDATPGNETGYELWVSDGTSAGTQLVRDINPDQSVIDRPQELTDVNGTLFFTSYDNGYYNRELWKSDGTAAGTVMVADLGIDPGDDLVDPSDDDPTISSYPSGLTNVDGVLYFAAEDFELGIELFKSDGTEAGTVMVADLDPAGSSDPTELTAFNGEVFFAADDGTLGNQLYKSDGVTIELVRDVTEGLGSANPTGLAVVGNELFFAANGSVPSTSISSEAPILTADNTSLNGARYAGIVSETTSASGGQLASFNNSISFNSTPQFGGDDGPGWVNPDTDNDPATPNVSIRIGHPGVGLTSIEVGDLYIEDIDPGDLVTNEWEWTIEDPGGLTNIAFSGFASGNEFDTSTPGDAEGLLFELFLNDVLTTTVDTLDGDELDNWLAPRTADNIGLTNPGGAAVTKATVRLSVGNGTYANYPDGGSEAIVVRATLSADVGAGTASFEDIGRELFKTDGTAGGTSLVADIVPIGSSTPSELREVGGKLFFSADDVTTNGRELWVSDGTLGGTFQLVDSAMGTDPTTGEPLDGEPELLGEIGGELLFTTTDGNQDRELWTSDGTSVGTTVVKNLNPSTQDADVRSITPIGTDIFFIANDGVNGEAVWKADTVANTATMVADVSPTSTDTISALTEFNGQVVFYNNSTGMNGGIYTTNPGGGFTELSTLRPEELDNDGTRFVVAGSRLYFVSDDGSTGDEIWSTDGISPAVVSEAVAGAAESAPQSLAAFDGDLYFSALLPVEITPTRTEVDRELFRLSGTGVPERFEINATTRTITVDDVEYQAPNSSSPDQFTVVGDRLYFTANDGVEGQELFNVFFEGAATTPTIEQVSDIRVGANSSFPAALTNVDGTLYFSADDGTNGIEPYRVNDDTTVAVANLNPTGSSNPGNFFSALGDVYFSADNGVDGQELYLTDGTTLGTFQVTDLQPGPGGSAPVPLFDTSQRLIFSASGTGTTDRELWATDGISNTLLIEDLFPSEFFGSDPEELVEVGGNLFFAATDELSGRELFELEESEIVVVGTTIGGVAGEPVAGELQRSSLDLVRVVFEGQVDVPASAIELLHRESNTLVTSVIVNSRFENGQTIVELTFAPGPHVISRDPLGASGIANSLDDGNYQLTILSANVQSPVSGAQLAADYQFGTLEADKFFRLYGDSDGDRDVDGQDYGRFGLTFLKSQSESGFNEDLDFDGDGDVDGQDYGRFGLNFLQTLPFV